MDRNVGIWTLDKLAQRVESDPDFIRTLSDTELDWLLGGYDIDPAQCNGAMDELLVEVAAEETVKTVSAASVEPSEADAAEALAALENPQLLTDEELDANLTALQIDATAVSNVVDEELAAGRKDAPQQPWAWVEAKPTQWLKAPNVLGAWGGSHRAGLLAIVEGKWSSSGRGVNWRWRPVDHQQGFCSYDGNHRRLPLLRGVDGIIINGEVHYGVEIKRGAAVDVREWSSPRAIVDVAAGSGKTRFLAEIAAAAMTFNNFFECAHCHTTEQAAAVEHSVAMLAEASSRMASASLTQAEAIAAASAMAQRPVAKPAEELRALIACTSGLAKGPPEVKPTKMLRAARELRNLLAHGDVSAHQVDFLKALLAEIVLVEAPRLWLQTLGSLECRSRHPSLMGEWLSRVAGRCEVVPMAADMRTAAWNDATDINTPAIARPAADLKQPTAGQNKLLHYGAPQLSDIFNRTEPLVSC
jgi:hypothetical protein